MYDIRQFRPMLYTLLLLGFTGYAVAAETPGLWILAVGGTLLNAYLVRKKAFKPLPRFVANMVTLAFAAWMLFRVRGNISGPTIFAIGEFLIFLQLVKLYEQRGNRDIAQLLVLSLLLMIAAAISTASLVFGIIFLAYMFLSLYCCLLFHLKAESDHARQVTGLDESKINPMTIRQDQRFLPRSMRRLTMVVSGFSVAMALAVFLLFPRGSGAGLIGNLAYRPQQAMTGFNDTIDFQNVAKISQNEALVAWVTIKKDNQPWGAAGETIYLRGNVADSYVSDPQDTARWTWRRSPPTPVELPSKPNGDESELLQQDIRLRPTGSKTLFALPGVVSFRSNRDLKATRGVSDDVLSSPEEGTSERTYTVYSTNASATPSTSSDRNIFDARTSDAAQQQYYPVPDEIKTFATSDEVAGQDEQGRNLARLRIAKRDVSGIDEMLARNYEIYLRTRFKYTLDLTNARIVLDKDPIVGFLTDFKRGHCEYFAGAMALMCQSVGMKARVVVGFKCDDYNTMGGYYTVRESDAHAWVEVQTRNGWQRFDPTSASEAGVGGRALTLWQRARAAIKFLEYKWGSSVVNYDSESQTNIISSTENQLSNTAMTTSTWITDLRDRITAFIDANSKWIDMANFYSVLAAMIGGAILLLIGFGILIVLLRLRLYRRARRIGLDTLSNNDQRRLARQLAFYDQMLKTLERRKIIRPNHLTPQEFGASVGYLPTEVFDIVQGLTRIFYRVRYGEAELQPAQQKRLTRSVERIDAVLGTTSV